MNYVTFTEYIYHLSYNQNYVNEEFGFLGNQAARTWSLIKSFYRTQTFFTDLIFSVLEF